MYVTCLFCNNYLDRNQVIEHCTVGRKLAFDSEKGRLWIICQACGGWNLTPLNERWEAIEECERVFAQTPVRISSENISLAVLYGELSLVRIGRPLRQELAIWRYADKLSTRRKSAYLRVGVKAADNLALAFGAGGAGGLIGAGIGAIAGGAPALIGVGILAGVAGSELWEEAGPSRIERLMGRIIARVKIDRIDYSYVRTRHVSEIRLAEQEQGWSLELPHSVGWESYRGGRAINIMGMMLPIANGFGATRPQVVEAVRALEEVGDAREFFEAAARRARKMGLSEVGVGRYPVDLRLALEMAAHEETERQALAGELKWLERKWRRAEAIAEIADNLFTAPIPVREVALLAD